MIYSSPISTMDDIVRIEKLENGYEVEVQDPDIAKKNQTSKGPWQDPFKAYSFHTSDEVCEFLKKVLDKLAPPTSADQFASAFKDATKEK